MKVKINKIPKEKVFDLLFIIILVSLFWFLQQSNDLNLTRINLFSYFFLYIAIAQFINILPDNKIKTILQFIVIGIPLVILKILNPFFRLFFAILLGMILPISLSYVLIHDFIPYLFQINLAYPVIIFLWLTISSILIVTFGDSLMSLTIHKVEGLSNSSEINNAQIDFIKSLINKDILRFLIYLLFFIALIFFSVTKLNDIIIFQNKDIDTAIIQAFVTFLAYDRIISNKKLFSINLKNTFEKLKNIWELDSHKNQ